MLEFDEAHARPTHNRLLIRARLRTPSPNRPGEAMSRSELADAMNRELHARHRASDKPGRAPCVDAHMVAKYERGRHRWPSRHYRDAFRAVLAADWDADLGFYPTRRRRSVERTVGQLPRQEVRPEAGMRRRVFLDRGAAIVALAAGTPPSLDALINVLTGPAEWRAAAPAACSGPAQVALDGAKRRYHQCEHSAAAALVAAVLSQLQHRDEQPAIAAGAYQLAASLLLKFGEAPLALVAADRSAAAARRTGDPWCHAASSRAVVHALSRNGHHQRAACLAREVAASLLDGRKRLRVTELAVAGALVLRGAVAAARGDDHDAARALLADADDLAAQLGADGEDEGTSFGRTNVVLHRVSAATAVGDAGAAIRYACAIAPASVTSVERRANLYLDLARAYNQREQWELTLRALQAAEDFAPEEIRLRPVIHDLIRDVDRRCPPSDRADTRQLAARAGVAL